jgi:hypothetical protein
MKILSIEIQDPIESHKSGAIEVELILDNGARRWYFFFTPEGASNCGDFIEGTSVRVHYGVTHMFLVSEMSKSIIETTLREVEREGEIELRTLAC